MCGEPENPNGGEADRSDSCDEVATCPKCEYWNQDHEKTVSGSSSKYSDSTQFGDLPIRFKFAVKLAGGEAVLTFVCKWGTVEGDPPLTEAMKTAVKTALTGKVPQAWSNAHSLKVVDPICGEKTLSIKFEVNWDDASGDAIDVNLQKAGRRSSASANVMNLDYDDDLDDDAWTLKHEFGHAIGNHDEYHYSGHSGEKITLKRADGGEETLNLEPASGNVMITRRDTTIEKRHLYLVEIEAQEWLRELSGRDVVCEIV